MTALVVTPIRLDQEGSYRERKAFLRLLKKLRALQGATDPDAILTVMDEADALLVGRLKTDDGTPVEDALDKLSANQFDQLLSAVAFEGGMGEAKAAPSASGPEGATPIAQTG